MTQLISSFAVVFTGVLSGTKYKIPGLRGYGRDGHWVVDKATADGVPRPMFIETFEQQKDFCKRNKLVNPKDVGSIEVGADGKSLTTCGLPSASKMAKELPISTTDQ